MIPLKTTENQRFSDVFREIKTEHREENIFFLFFFFFLTAKKIVIVNIIATSIILIIVKCSRFVAIISVS